MASIFASYGPDPMPFALRLPRLPRSPREIHDSESAAYFTRVGPEDPTGALRSLLFPIKIDLFIIFPLTSSAVHFSIRAIFNRAKWADGQ